MAKKKLFVTNGDESVHLHSENGTAYELSVDNSGALTVTNEATGAVSGGGGGGLPTGGAAHQMLVTDAEGKALWEDRLAYAYTGLVEVLPETTVEVDPDSMEGMIAEPLAGNLVVGDEYTVTYNGVEYVCKAQEVQADVVMTCLGNVDAVTGGEGTGEPFVFMELPSEAAAEMGAYAGLYALDGATSVTIKIVGESEVVQKVPDKFLPVKTHWVTEKDTEVLPETTLSVPSSKFAPVVTSLKNDLEIGAEYIVIWNGAEYRCVAESARAGAEVVGALLGNGESFGATKTEAPFCFVDFSPEFSSAYGTNRGVFVYDESESATIAIVEPAGTIHKLDAKFMPPGVVTSVNGKAGDVSLTAEDVGADTKGTAQALLNNMPVYRGSGTGSIRGPGGAGEGDSYKMGTFGVAFAEGGQSSGRASFTAGNYTDANAYASFASGDHTIASGLFQNVQGRYNIEDTADKYAHIVGNGESDAARSNAHTLDWDGNAWFAGYVEGTKLILPSPNGTRWAITVGDDGTLSAAAVTE